MQSNVIEMKNMTMPSNLIAPSFKKNPKDIQTIPIDNDENERTSPTDFFFFLDAWQYCHKHSIPTSKIQRKSWKIWHLVGVEPAPSEKSL